MMIKGTIIFWDSVHDGNVESFWRYLGCKSLELEVGITLLIVCVLEELRLSIDLGEDIAECLAKSKIQITI